MKDNLHAKFGAKIKDLFDQGVGISGIISKLGLVEQFPEQEEQIWANVQDIVVKHQTTKFLNSIPVRGFEKTNPSIQLFLKSIERY